MTSITNKNTMYTHNTTTNNNRNRKKQQTNNNNNAMIERIKWKKKKCKEEAEGTKKKNK